MFNSTFLFHKMRWKAGKENYRSYKSVRKLGVGRTQTCLTLKMPCIIRYCSLFCEFKISLHHSLNNYLYKPVTMKSLLKRCKHYFGKDDLTINSPITMFVNDTNNKRSLDQPVQLLVWFMWYSILSKKTWCNKPFLTFPIKGFNYAFVTY